MKNKYLMTLLALLVASVSTTAQAQPQAYGTCGDGVVEVYPYGGANGFPPADGAAFQAPASINYFYGQTTHTPGYAPHPLTSATQGVWPTTTGEMCDSGPNSPVLCSASCILINDGANVTNQFLKEDIKECYKSTKCSPGIGNGIIQPSTENGVEYNEQCDDGNISDGDGCSSKGQIELAESYVKDVCGNGVVDPPNEKCDDGNNRNGDGCSADCQTIDSTPKTCEGTSTDKTQKVCGNKRVDYALGEQCDGGDSCREKTCTFEFSPYFTEGNIAWWGETDGVMLDQSSDGTEGSQPGLFVNPSSDLAHKDCNKYLYDCTRDPDETKNFSIQNHGQKIIIPHNGGKQYAGVFLSGQHIKNIQDNDTTKIFKDKKIHMSLVFSPTYGNDELWDDDAFGIVFGMKNGEQDKIAKTNPDYKYLMLSWRSYAVQNWTGGYVKPGCESNARSKYGTPGLRLYQIEGAPSYTQLWTMSNCQPETGAWSTTGKITEISTSKINGQINANTGLWTVNTQYWNKVVNPFLPLSTFYAYNFGYGQSNENQRLQIDVEFSNTELKVWVNKVLAIDVLKDQLIAKEGTNGIEWPTKGQLGFYFMGMDNITIDASGYYSYVDKNINPDDEKNKPSTSCKNFCGNGITEVGEDCDDGNTDDADGCNSKCKNSTDTGPGGICVKLETKTLCYGGTLDSPKDHSTVDTTPVISGTYTGATANILVEVKDDNGVVICEGSVVNGNVKKENGKWKLLSCANAPAPGAPFSLTKDGNYHTTATFVPAQSSEGKDAKPLTVEASFTLYEKKTWLTVEEPSDDPVSIAPTLDHKAFKVSGKASNNIKKVTIKVCTKNVPEVCGAVETVTTKTDGTWSSDFPALPDGCQEKDDQCVLKVIPVVGGSPVDDAKVEKDVVLTDDYNLPIPRVSAPKDNQQVIPNADNTITIQGTVPASDSFGTTCVDAGTFKENTCAKVYVKVESECMVNASRVIKSIIVPLNKDLTYTADVPIAEGCDTHEYIRVWSIDNEGRKSERGDITVKIAGRRTPKISIKCPHAQSPGESCKLLNNDEGDGLVVNGQTNIQAQRPVVVKAYKKDPNADCDFAELQKGKTPPDAAVTVKSTNQGKWAADLKHLDTGEYCILATLKSQDGSETLATSSTVAKYIRKNISKQDIDKPIFVSTGGDVAKDILKGGDTVPVTVTVDPNSHVVQGDKCIISVKGDDTWNKDGTFEYDTVSQQWLCTANIDSKKGDENLIGKELTAVVQDKENKATSKPADPELTIPGAHLAINDDGTATVTFDTGYPVADGETISINDADGEVGKCIITAGVCKTTEPLKKDGVPLKKLPKGTETKVYASSDGVKITDEVTVTGTSPKAGEKDPADGTNKPGGGPVRGKVQLNTNGSATVKDIAGADAGDKLTVVATVDGTEVTKVCWVQADKTCTTEPFNPDPDKVGKLVAKNGNDPINTWTRKVTSDKPNDKVTAKYAGPDDDKVVVTLPESAKQTPGKTLEVTIDGKSYECKVDDSGTACTTTTPVLKDGKRLEGDSKVDVTTLNLEGLLDVPDDANGFVSGGCSTTDAPEGTLLGLLFGALGLFLVRRRRED